MWVGHPTGDGSTLNIIAQRLFDLTPQNGNPATADPNSYDIGASDIFNMPVQLVNDGSLATWRPDVDCGDGVTVAINSGYSGILKHPNGLALRADDLKTSARVVMIQHNDPPSVEADGDYDTSGRWWQLIAPAALAGLMDVDLATVADEGQALTYDTATAKWMAPVQYGVATTDATLTTARTLTVADTTSYLIEARIVARQTGGAAGAVGDTAAFVIQGTFEATGGSVTQTGATQAAYTENSVDATWAVAFSVSGLTVKIDVTGAVNKNLTWRVLAKMHKVAG